MPSSLRLTFEGFVQSLYSGRPVLEILGLTAAAFAQASPEQRLKNPVDEAGGVTKVLVKLDAVFFGLFDKLLIKHYEDGARRYQFYTTTRDVTAILRAIQQLTATFGTGYYEEGFAQPFTPAVVASLAQGLGATSQPACGQMWSSAHYTVLLHYCHSRPLELLLSVAEQPPVDRAVRTKGTVASLFPFRLADVLAQAPLDQAAGAEENGAVYVDYLFALSPAALGAFDLAQVRVLGLDPALCPQVTTHVTLRAAGQPAPARMQEVATELIALYGADGGGAEALTEDEVAALHGDYWSGRLWDFDQQHRLWHLGDPVEERLYTVALTFDSQGNGFALTILDYEQLARFQP